MKGKPHKTDRNDALMLARMAHANLLSPVYIRSANAHERKALVVVRGRLVSTRNALTNAIRGHLKPFGLTLGRVKAAEFDHRVRELSEAHPLLRLALDSLLTVRARASDEIDLLNRQILALAKEDAVCRSLMSIPSIGALAAVTFTSVIDDPHRFAQSSQIANYLGLTPINRQETVDPIPEGSAVRRPRRDATNPARPTIQAASPRPAIPPCATSSTNAPTT